MTAPFTIDTILFSELYEAYQERDMDKMHRILTAHPSLVNYLSPDTSICGAVGLIHHAATDNDTKMLTFLLDHNADIHLAAKDAPPVICGIHNALGRAVAWGETEAVQLLLARGFDMNHPSIHFDDHPMRIALNTGKSEKMEILLEHGISADNIKKFCLYDEAVKAGARDMMDRFEAILAAQNAPLTQDDLNTALYWTKQIERHTVVSEKRLQCAAYLLERGAQPDAFFKWRSNFATNVEAFSVVCTLAMMGKRDLVSLMLPHTGTPIFETRTGRFLTIEEATHGNPGMLALLKNGDRLQQEFSLKKMQPAIDGIYSGGDRPLKIPQRKPQP